jgi:hypothetical protein
MAMVKKARKQAAAKVAKRSTKKKSAKKKSAKKKSAGRKAAVAKKRRKVAAKVSAPKKFQPISEAKPAAKAAVPPPRKTIVERLEGAVGAVADIFTDAEQLHHRLDPDPSRDPDPE